VEVQCYSTNGGAPAFVLRGPGASVQTVSTSLGAGRQYLGTLFGAGNGLSAVFLQTIDLASFAFFRATLINVFG
jgi:hypothetical protein